MLRWMRASIPGWGALSCVLLIAGLGAGCGDDDDARAGTGGAGGSGGSGGGGPTTCAAYCDTIMAACTGASAQYGAKDMCVASCGAFSSGTPGEQSGNSLECRASHANLAKSAPSHCPHAGPAGDAVCGANCEGYCTLMLAHCPGAYASASECATACSGITGATEAGYDTGTKTGDSLFCRIYHATAASTDPSTHCDHAKLNPTAACS